MCIMQAKMIKLEELKVLNFGLELFEESLKKQNVEVVQVNWKPEANGDLRLLEIIDKLEDMDI